MAKAKFAINEENTLRVDNLIANGYLVADRRAEALATMNTADESGSGSATDQAGGEEDSDLGDYESDEGRGLEDDVKVGGKGKKPKLATNAWLATAPPDVREAVQNAMKVTHATKLRLVRQLIANVEDRGLRTRLGQKYLSLPLAELQERLLLLPTANVSRYEPPSPTYNFGADVPSFDGVTQNAADAEDVLPLPTANYAEWAKDVGRRQA